MGKLFVLNLLPGNFEIGFPAILEIWEEGKGSARRIVGHLPSAPHILESFSSWKAAFDKKANPSSREPSANRSRATVTGHTKSSCEQEAKKLVVEINKWLNSGDREWQKIRDGLQQNLSRNDENRVIIQTENLELRLLPWQMWNLFAEVYTKAEIALSEPEYQLPNCTVQSQSKVRIIAVLGDNQGIDIDFDLHLLKDLETHGAIIHPLKQPTKKQLLEALWSKKGWHIFFFAGHSESQDNGEIGLFKINSSEILTIDELKNTISDAIANGLQLAIFNSCDGLGLAKQLAKLHIPQSLVMRQPIPDLVAPEFLQHFLTAFADNKSFYGSVLVARRRIEDAWNQQYPGISWLPVICQNPAVVPPTWRGFLGEPDKPIPHFHTTNKGLWKCEHMLTGHSDIVRSVAISPDGQILASGSLDRTIKLWNLATGELLNTIAGHTGGVTCVTFSPDGQTLASSSAHPDGKIKLWHPSTGKLKGSFNVDVDALVVLTVWAIAFSPDGQTLASGHHADSTVKNWNLSNGELLHALRGHVWAVNSVAFSPDGNIFVSGGADSNIKIWNSRTGREIRNLNGPSGWFSLAQSFISDKSVHSVAFSPDGQILASGGDKQPIQLWRLSNGELRSSLEGHSGSVHSVAFSPDGQTLASGSADRTIRIWDLVTGEPSHTLEHSDTVYSVAFSPDGQTLISGSKDRTIKIWRLS
jgi:WD40 repeat protein